jgi:type IV pilus biogenesis protein CpaD/CtpE
MKIILLACGLALLSGCTSQDKTARVPVEDKERTHQLAAIDAHAMELVKRGYTYRDARAVAESQYEGFATIGRMEDSSMRRFGYAKRN